MSCLACGRHVPRDEHGDEKGWCHLCESNLNRSEESILQPIGPLAQLIERTSLEDFILFLIALDRRDRAAAPPEVDV